MSDTAMLQAITFEDLAPIEVQVMVGQSKYVLREASGDAANKYRGASLRGVEMTTDEDGNRTTKRLQSVAEVEPYLVSLCLYIPDDAGKVRLNRDGDADPRWLVPIQRIRSWPARIQKTLFERIKDISALDETETLEQLEKQLLKLQTKVAKMKAKQVAGSNGSDEGSDPNVVSVSGVPGSD